MKRFSVLLLLPVLALPFYPQAAAGSALAGKDPWGIVAGFRIARIPYPTTDRQVSDFIPLMFYEGDLLFLRGLA